MFNEQWDILLVDDEPDVLSLSKLVMRRFEIYDLPLAIHTARSKAQAIELLNDQVGLLPRISVAFIDVVMESNTAGLELCHYIREGRGNKLSQLFIRTGQPGIAPERDVIDRYDISGYLTKAEATEDKLYSLVKSGIRQHLWSKWSFWLAISFQDMVRSAVSQSSLLHAPTAGLQRFFTGFHGRQGMSPPDSEAQYGYLKIGDQLIGSSGWDESEGAELCTRLQGLTGTPLNLYGDKYVIDENDNQMISVVMPTTNMTASWLFRSSLTLPAYVITLAHQVLAGWVTLWQHSRSL